MSARQAALRLGALKDPRARPHLEQALRSPDVGLRVGAASALGAIGHSASRPGLEAMLVDPDWRARAQAAYALSRIHDPRSTGILAETLGRDPSALVRNASALALGRIGDPRAIPWLVRALDDESDRVRREAIIALERAHDPGAPEKVRRFLRDPVRRVRIAATLVAGLRRDQSSVPELLELLARADHWEKPAIMVALGRIGTPESGAALARSADDEVRWVRVCALHGLAEMRAPQTREVARSKLADPSWAVRGAAALALGNVGRHDDAGALVPLLRDPSAWVRRAAVYGLGMLGLADRSPEIRGALEDPDPEVSLAAIWALGRLADRASAPRLIELLGQARPHPPSHRTVLVEGDGAVRLVSDAHSRRFDALVQALSALAARWPDPPVFAALESARRGLTEVELDRPARLPSPLGPGEGARTLRSLFEVGPQ